MANKSYELAAETFHQVTSKPGETFAYKTYTKGDKVALPEDRARELIEAGALVDPSASTSGKAGGQTKAPSKDSSAGGTGDPAGTGATGGGGDGTTGTVTAANNG